MKEGMFLGLLAGMLAGAIIYRYSSDVQKLADKGETMVKEEVSKLKKANVAQKPEKPEVK